MQGRDLPEKQQHASPFRSLPGHVGLNEKDIGDERAKTAQPRDKSKLTDLFAQARIEINRAEMQAAVGGGDRMLGRQFGGAE